jgi:hypothetical protein
VEARLSRLEAFDLAIGFDCEYVAGANFDPLLGPLNAVVSYQAAIMNPSTGTRQSGVFFPSGPNKNQRVSMGGYLGKCICAAEQSSLIEHIDAASLKARARARTGRPVRTAPPLRIAMCAHFSRADLCCFRDFPRLKKKFDGVRKTFASVKRPARLTAVLPDGRRIDVSVTLFDTRLLAPAGKSTLRELGDLLGFPELDVPDVIDETGATTDGIERMDLVLRQHPDEFDNYAKRDAEVSVEWLCRFLKFAADWHAHKTPSTVGSLAVHKVISIMEATPNLVAASFLGRMRDKRGGLGDALPELRGIQATAADCFHGGRNESYEHGFIRGYFRDFDLSGAYTSSMALFREIDWARIEHTTDLDRLTVLDQPTFARVDFEFPPGTRFPCLPIDGAGYGLIYPLSGSCDCPGPELVVARNMAAKIIVREGIVLNWLDPNSPRPFVEFAKTVNKSRKKHQKGSALELLAKEAGNSAYGKIAQAVGSMKTKPVHRKVFYTRDGVMATLPASRITNPIFAALTSGLPRAVLSEILSRLPDHVIVASATTDGWLSTATEEEARYAADGPVSRHFRNLRALVSADGSDEILEMKHAALKILQVKTRGTFDIEPSPGSEPIIARAGHRLDKPADTPMDEVREWERIYRTREYTTELTRRDFVSIRNQWYSNGDLTAKYRRNKVALDWDFKRRPVDLRDEDGCIRFTSEPWATIDEFLEWRRDFESWRASTGAVLKTTADWERFLASRHMPKAAMMAKRTAFQQALMVALARTSRPPGRYASGPTRAEIARRLTEAGIHGVTEYTLGHAAKGKPDPTGTVDFLTEADLATVNKLANFVSPEMVQNLRKKAPPEKGKHTGEFAALPIVVFGHSKTCVGQVADIINQKPYNKRSV